MIRALVFDFDGTLVPSNAIKRAAFAEAVGHMSGAAEQVETLVAARPTADRHTIFRALCEQRPDCGEPAELAARYGTICEDRIVPLLRDSEVGVLFRCLQGSGMTLHVSSATPRDALYRILERGGLAPYLASVHGASESKTCALRSILREGGYQPDEVAVVGDGESDRAAAWAVSCCFVPVTPDASQLYGRPASAAFDFLAQNLPLRHAADR